MFALHVPVEGTLLAPSVVTQFTLPRQLSRVDAFVNVERTDALERLVAHFALVMAFLFVDGGDVHFEMAGAVKRITTQLTHVVLGLGVTTLEVGGHVPMCENLPAVFALLPDMDGLVTFQPRRQIERLAAVAAAVASTFLVLCDSMFQ